MSNYKVEFTLRQHTPIIHFQADQPGATLRATELKPKLDRFLIEKLKMVENGKPKAEYKSWFVGGGKQHLALDYKVTIYFSGINKIDEPKPSVKRGDTGYVAPYFADGVSIDQTAPTKVTFKSMDTVLIDAIRENFTILLAKENFGTRQSKGFGSYFLDNATQKEFESLIKQLGKHIFHFSGSYGNGKNALHKIDTFYKYLKMAQRSPIYDRSLLFQFMCEKYDIGWEKRYLKEKFPEIIHGEHAPIYCKTPIDDSRYKYIRALLGLAEHNEYRPKSGKKQIRIESVERDPSDKKKARYQRFKSPITFKVFDGHVYIIYNESYQELLDKEFYFSLRGRREKLYTPSQFSMYEFLKFVEKKIPYFKELT
jgi:hypothetical protein